MKATGIKQFLVFALFACSLSADVPLRREAAVATMPEPRRVHRPAPALSGVPAATSSLRLNAAHTLAMAPVLPSAATIWEASDVLAGANLTLWPPARNSACLEVPAVVVCEASDVPMDPVLSALFLPRSRMPLALLEYAWERPAGSWGQNRLSDMYRNSERSSAETMITRLKKVFEKEHVPQQWVWIAEVESSLNPRALSSAGAAGLFQLMPGTAQRFGLRTEPEDDRMAPEKSAVAAAQYLKILHREFGCWSLALAAYNAGEGRVKEIMKKRKARTYGEVERYLPAETQAYVPKVMAVVALREDRFRGLAGSYWMP